MKALDDSWNCQTLGVSPAELGAYELLVRDIWEMQGISLDDKDSLDSQLATRLIFTPDELIESDKLKRLGGIIF
ncbi:MAG: hypothetical protein WBI40_07175 [Methylococcaceae bacterium]